MTGTVGFAGVTDPETPVLDRQETPGLCYRGRGRLRVGSNAEIGHEVGNVVALTQNHVLKVVNAIGAVLGAAPGGGSIGSGFIGLASASMVCEADGAGFVQINYDLEVGAPQGPEPEPSEPEGDFLMGHEAGSPEIDPTPSLGVANAQLGAQSTQASTLVGHIFAVANAIHGYIVQPIPGFANRSQGVANARMDHAAGTASLTKRIVPVFPRQSMQSDTVSLQRIYFQNAANATQGHLATASGVSPAAIRVVSATQGDTSTAAAVTYRALTSPHSSTDGMIVSAPTITVNVVDPGTGVTAASIFGTGISTTSEGAIPIGSTGTHPNTTAVAIRFKAKRTSTLTSAKVSLRGSGGNSFGQPLLEARILKDDNTASHKPVDSQRTGVTVNGNRVTYTGTSAHVGSVADLVSADNTLGRFTFVWSSGAPSLVRNVLYHLELRNAHSDPGNNWTSLDTLVMSPAQSPSQPIVSDTDSEVLQRSTGGVWSAQSQNSPIFSLGYADGRAQGQAYLWSPQAGQQSVTGPNNRVRERFVSNNNLRVHKVAVRAGRWSGSQPLQIRIIREGNGAVLASAAADSGYFPAIDQAATDNRQSHRWYAHSFVSSFTVSAGVTATVDLQTTANAEYRVGFLKQDGGFPLSAAFYQGDGQFTGDGGVTWIDSTAQAGVPGPNGPVPGDMMFYLGLGSAAQRPRASADSFGESTGFIIGNTTTVSARQLILNDTNPSGTHSATTAFPNGVNPLQLFLANSATNCGVTLSTANQTIGVSAKTSNAAFTYVVRDIYGQRSSARVTVCARSSSAPPPSQSGLKPIYSNADLGMDLTIARNSYGWRRSSYVGMNAIDIANPSTGTADPDNPYRNGIWDLEENPPGDPHHQACLNRWLGGSGLGRITSQMRTDRVPFSFDWEGTSSSSLYDNYSAGLGGLSGTASAQDIAERTGLAMIADARSREPNIKWGFYDVPRSNQPDDFLSYAGSHDPFMNQVNVISGNFWSQMDVIHQRAYVTYTRNDSVGFNQFPSSNSYQCSITQVEAFLPEMAKLGHQCAAKAVAAGRSSFPLVIPYCSVQYFGSVTGSGRFNGSIIENTEAGNFWIYKWIYEYCNYTHTNGRKADGVYIWGQASAVQNINEARLKAIYQAVNGLPFDPSMPRPS